MDEIRRVVRKLKPRKAPGLDGIHTEVMQFLEEDLLDDLLVLYN